MRKKVYGVRTKCDDKDEEDEKIKQQDIEDFKEHGCVTEVFFTSKNGGADNELLLKHILNY